MRGWIWLLAKLMMLLAISCRADTWPDGDEQLDTDLDLLLDMLRRTRGSTLPKQIENPFDPEFSGPSDDLLSLFPALRGESELENLPQYSPPPKAPRKPKSKHVAKTKYRKDSVDADSLRTREKYQKAQADRLRKAFKEGKPQITLVDSFEVLNENRSWFVPCVREFYEDAYGVVRGCTPSIARGGMCSRVVHDGFGTPRQMTDMVAITEAAMKNLFHQGGTTSLAPASSLDRLGTKGAILFQYLLYKVKMQLLYEFNLDVIYDSGALLTRLKADPPHDEWDMEPGCVPLTPGIVEHSHVYWNPHVDKANIPTYDYSALLYLNSHGPDFDGGQFAFIDDDADRIVEPRAGRLVMFTSGPENLHQVREVTRGTRYVLAMWFTCSEQFQYRDDD